MSGASRVSTSRAAAQTRALDTAPQTPTGAVGVTERGPDYALVTSYDEFKAVFGGPSLNSADMDLAAKCYFEEGGKLLHVARVVHCADPSDPATKTSAAATLTLNTAVPGATSGSTQSAVGPFSLAAGDQLSIKVDAGGTQTITVAATAAARESAAAGGGFSLANGQTLTLAIDGGAVLTKTFATSEFVNITTATAAEVRNALNAFFAAQSAGAVAAVTNVDHVTITSNRLGTGSGVNVTGGTANAALAFTTGNQAGTGNVSNVAAVTATELAAALTALPLAGGTAVASGSRLALSSATTGGSSSVQVLASGAAAAKLGFDNAVHAGLAAVAQSTLRVDGASDGAYGNALSIQVAAPSNGATGAFNLYVLRGGSTIERFYNLTMDPTSPAYAPTVVNLGAGTQTASKLIQVTDLSSTVPSPGNIPASGTFGPMTGGNDGLVGLTDADFSGGSSTNGATGMRLFDIVDNDEMSILIVPGRSTSAAQNGANTYCEVFRGGKCFFIPDPPAGLTIAQMRTYWSTTAGLKELSEIMAGYYPRILVDNPSTSVFGPAKTLVAPPSGALAGLCARIDASKDGGAFEHPASREIGVLRSARGLETDEVKDETKRGLLFDDRINPLMQKNGQVYVDGARCAKSTGPFPTVGESRGIIFLQQTISQAEDPKRNRNNRPRLRNELKMMVEPFMSRLTKAECFASTKDEEAWYFDIGDALNSAPEQAAGNVNQRLGVATSKPGEFINIVFVPK